MTDFKHAIETFNKHSDKKYHRDAIIVMDNFVKSMSGQTQSISVQISDATRKLVERNRQKLRSIVETIIFCGRQNIALRGSFESYSDVEERTSKNHGNFWALIKFRISAGDTILQDHFATTSRNATYTSPTIQNDIINIVGDHIRQILISKVRTAQFFSLIADEVTDCSNKEQLAIVLRHVDPDNNQIREDLVDFVECDTGITGKALADKMLEFLKKQCLDLSKLCGQTYDGAASMSGKIKGAAAIITSKYPLALYTHCASHRLNLAVAHSFSETCVQNMISIVNRVSTFFWAHPKRQKKLDEAIDSIQPTSSVSKLKDLCRTRWIERIDALDRFHTLHESIVECFQIICSEGRAEWSQDSITDAVTLKSAITTTEFISSLVIASKLMMFLLGLTRSLQAEAKDILQASTEVNHLISTLKEVREKVDDHHRKWFDEIEAMCSKVAIIPSMPRLSGRQQNRSNTPASSPSQYFLRTISIPMLDHLLQELKTRFDDSQRTTLQGFCLIPSIMVSMNLEIVLSKLGELGNMYSSDLPYVSSLKSEGLSWYIKWRDQATEHGAASLPSSLHHTLPQVSQMFPNIKTLLLILCSLAVTSCTAERSFSALKRIKSSLRSTMGNNRLSSLSLVHVHRDIDIDIDQVIDEFARRHPRRLQLESIINS